MAENINRRGFIQSGSTLAFASLLPAKLLASIKDIPVSPFGFVTTADEVAELATLYRRAIKLLEKVLKITRKGEPANNKVLRVHEIREEIKNEIRVVAESEELDLVLEKAVSAENPRAGLGFHWAIVHFAKPEFDITQKVADRLNERFKRP